eukprot:2240800-Lingulodinium_polyedra.AAC.1
MATGGLPGLPKNGAKWPSARARRTWLAGWATMPPAAPWRTVNWAPERPAPCAWSWPGARVRTRRQE